MAKLRKAGAAARAETHDDAQELLVRHATRDGRPVATLRALDHGDSCVVEAEIYPQSKPNADPVTRGPYRFDDAHAATAFVVESVEALMYLGCDIA